MNKRRASTGVSNRYRATTEESLQFVRQRREINKEAVALPVKNTGSEITRVCDEFIGRTAIWRLPDENLIPPQNRATESLQSYRVSSETASVRQEMDYEMPV